jgi:xylose isomerase
MLALIASLDHPERVGVNPEFAHETMAGLNFAHHVAQALDAGKLFHIDLNGQKPGRFDQDLRFGSEDLKGTLMLVHLLETQGYDGPRHFDAHAYRTEDSEGVWDFARGCMRTYLILKEKSRKLAQDPEIQAILKEVQRPDPKLEALTQTFTPENAAKLKKVSFDPDELAKRRLPYERLDQLLQEVILGIR